MTIDEPVADILARLQGLSAEEILADAAARYPGRVALASSLSLEDQALTHMIAAGGLGIAIFTLDTGRLHPEAYDAHRPHQQALRVPHARVLPGRGRSREDGRGQRHRPLP